MQPGVKSFCGEKLLAADKTGQEFKTRPVAHIQLMPHVKDVIDHAVVTKTLTVEHSVNLLEQVWSISIE